MNREQIQELEAAISAFITSKARYYKAKREYTNAMEEYEAAQANDNRPYHEKSTDIAQWLAKCDIALSDSQNAVIETQAAIDVLIPILDKLGYEEVIIGNKSFAVHPEHTSIFNEGYDVDKEEWTKYVAPLWAVIGMYI